MRSIFGYFASATAAIAWLGVRPAGAQVYGPPPTPAECASYASALTSGSRDSGQWGRVSACGSVGGNALARALNAARTETDSLYLVPLTSAMAAIRDSAVMRVARLVALDATASYQARAVSLLTLLTQYDNGQIGVMGFAAMLADSTESTCPIGIGGSSSSYQSTTISQPTVGQVAETADLLYYGAGTPATLRSFARCVRISVAGEAPLRVPDSALVLTYVCGNTFKVRNNGLEYAMVSLQVGETSEQADVEVAPGTEELFDTETVGTVRMRYFGTVIGSVAHGGTICP
jgi:hypothetical protein